MLLLAASVVAVLGLPGGAPEGACNTFTPGHNNPTNQADGDVPFYVNTSAIGDSYTPDYTYTSKWKLFNYVVLYMHTYFKTHDSDQDSR